MIISIVTPVLNGGPYFRECLESVQAASNGIEHIIVDGGSTDGSIELARRFPVRLLREPDTGMVARINLGYRAAKGELIGFLGADDVLLPGAIEAIVAAHLRAGMRWVVGGVRWIDANGESLGEFAAPPSWLTVSGYSSLDWNMISHLATYMHRDMFRELGGCDERYRISADFDLFARALRREPFARIARPLACWRRHGGNFSVAHKHLAVSEANTIRQSLGLRSGLGRSLQKLTMKIWVNLSNPKWCRQKITEKIDLCLGRRTASHYE